MQGYKTEHWPVDGHWASGRQLLPQLNNEQNNVCNNMPCNFYSSQLSSNMLFCKWPFLMTEKMEEKPHTFAWHFASPALHMCGWRTYWMAGSLLGCRVWDGMVVWEEGRGVWAGDRRRLASGELSMGGGRGWKEGWRGDGGGAGMKNEVYVHAWRGRLEYFSF